MTNLNLPVGLGEKKRLLSPAESIAYPSKMRKLGDGTVPGSSSSKYNIGNGSTSTKPQLSGMASSSMNATPRSEAQHSETQISQVTYIFFLCVFHNHVSTIWLAVMLQLYLILKPAFNTIKTLAFIGTELDGFHA